MKNGPTKILPFLRELQKLASFATIFQMCINDVVASKFKLIFSMTLAFAYGNEVWFMSDNQSTKPDCMIY